MDENETPPPTTLKRRGPLAMVIVALLVLAIGGGVVWWALGMKAQSADVPDAGVVVVDAGPPPAALDPAAGDALISGDLVPKEWLAGGDIVRRAATAVYSVSIGQSPRVVMAFLEPGGEFVVDEVLPPGVKKKPKPKGKKKAKVSHQDKTKYFISEKNDARYDAATAAFTRIDAAAVGQMYAKLRPYLESAFHEVAPPGKTFDAAFIAAVDRLAAVPITDGPREVVPAEEGITYLWKDPKLEALKPAEKHLLRMGPKNARAVVKQLQAFRDAMAAADAGH